MTCDEVEAALSFHCAYCENLKDEPFYGFQSRQKHIPAKIWVKNLPNGISESGLRNLFITSGRPKNINYFISSNSALVEFECIRDSELAIRDLHCKPPYKLKLSVADDDTNKPPEKIFEAWDFSKQPENIIENLFESENNTEEKNNELDKGRRQLEVIASKLPFDPSIRMRQLKLDFKTEINCVSLGRGYLNMGEVDRYIGGLQKFKLGSKKSKAIKQVNSICQLCEASTTKMCGHCLKPYCSKVCLSKSSIDHKEQCSTFRSGNIEQSEENKDSKFNSNEQSSFEYSLFDKKLTSGCTVVMSTYLTMKSVFVRRSDKEWNDEFTRFCNDVAEVALKGDKLDSTPKIDELYIAKYYKDLCFYRARIISVSQNAADFVFVDFGNSQETNLEDVRPLPSHLKSVPELAVKVKLSNMSEGSSLEAVDYYNRLTAEKIPLILEFEEGSEEVVLKEEDLKMNVNETASHYSLPSWKKDSSVISKLSEVFFKNSLTTEKLNIGETNSLIICHFDENEFLDSEVLWAIKPDTCNYFHVNSEMHDRITEYCEFLKNDYYLPRTNELCLVKEEGKWHRCINLKSQKTTCCVFFVDDGHSSFVETSHIRKMIEDFTEAPAQAICCTLPDNISFKTNKELRSKVVEYLKACVGQRINHVRVLKLMGDAYCLFIPDIQNMLS